MDLERANDVLQRAGNLLSGLTTARLLPNATVERWVSDQPVVTLRWLCSDGINRNINAVLKAGDGVDEMLSIEENAWQDTVDERGCLIVRNWAYARQSLVPASVESEILVNTIEAAFCNVSKWSAADLRRAQV